jgi:hypothetical protein
MDSSERVKMLSNQHAQGQDVRFWELLAAVLGANVLQYSLVDLRETCRIVGLPELVDLGDG